MWRRSVSAPPEPSLVCFTASRSEPVLVLFLTLTDRTSRCIQWPEAVRLLDDAFLSAGTRRALAPGGGVKTSWGFIHD